MYYRVLRTVLDKLGQENTKNHTPSPTSPSESKLKLSKFQNEPFFYPGYGGRGGLNVSPILSKR